MVMNQWLNVFYFIKQQNVNFVYPLALLRVKFPTIEKCHFREKILEKSRLIQESQIVLKEFREKNQWFQICLGVR